MFARQVLRYVVTSSDRKVGSNWKIIVALKEPKQQHQGGGVIATVRWKCDSSKYRVRQCEGNRLFIKWHLQMEKVAVGKHE